MSERFGLENKMLNRLIALGHDGFELYCQADLGNYIWFASFLPFVRHAVSKLCENRKESMGIMKKYVDMRRKTFDPSLNEDLIDSFLYEEYTMNGVNKEKMKDLGEGFRCIIK